jgi:ankyrin repeat protein
LDIVEYLVGNGASLDLYDKVSHIISLDLANLISFSQAGRTAFHLAAKKGHLEVGECLRSHGVALEIKSKVITS